MTRASLNAATGIPLRFANRHGLITGPTGTGKTVTLMRLAEQFSRAGSSVFIADVKGDIAALSRSCPADFLDLFGAAGRPIRVTFDAMGPDLIARALELTDAQAGTVEIAMAYARDHGISVATIADMRALVSAVMRDRDKVQATYGQATGASLGVVLRGLLRLEGQGGAAFFGAPAFDVADLLEPRVSILAAERLLQSPRLYAAFLLFMIADLFARLPEVGDLDRPRLVFFFDEAHLLFQDCPPALLRRLEQTVRLIRSKGVGLYFVTQSPDDVPAVIREQLAHQVAHDRALPVGVARVATMTEAGQPAQVVQVRIDPPSCELGALEPAERPAPAIVPPMPGDALRPGAMDSHGIAFLWGCAAFVVLLGCAMFGLWEAGKLGLALAAAVGAVVGLRKRFRLT